MATLFITHSGVRSSGSKHMSTRRLTCCLTSRCTGVREVEFPVDILYNSDVEWHEAFTVLLGPEDPEGAMFGPITMATITILDNEVSGSLVLPAPPVVSHRVMCGESRSVT